MRRRIILHCRLSPGDILTMTAAVESLHSRYPREFQTDVRTPCPEIWEHNPWVTSIADSDGEHLDLEYPTIQLCNETLLPFLDGYTRNLGHRLGVPLELTTNRPHLYLSDDERIWINQVRQHVTGGRDIPFWLVNAGVKSDYTAKQWPVEYYQEVVNATRGRIQWVQIGSQEHDHPLLSGVIDFRGKTDGRQLIRLAYHAQGGIGPVTYLQHLMAAWEKPYLCVVGGREPVPWITYPRQHIFHTIGQLPCCSHGACWRSRVMPLDDGQAHDQGLCQEPVLGGVKPVARCMALIRPEELIAVLERSRRADCSTRV